ncbi:MAG TPA: hypothetical protein VH600_03110 [Burkholderiales bacterium]
MKSRTFIVAVVAFWLAVGPAASAWAHVLEKVCDTTSMAMSHDGCCDDEMDTASCLSSCLMASPAIPVATPQTMADDPAQSPVLGLALEHASVLAPPDVAPPKSFVS